MYKLKKNITAIAKQKGLPISTLEKEAGLRPSLISNLLQGKSKNPGIESIIKISKILDVSIDDLVGIEFEYKIRDLDITQIDLFLEIINHLSKNIKTKKTPLQLEKYSEAINEIYISSVKLGKLDIEFANWFINNRLY